MLPQGQSAAAAQSKSIPSLGFLTVIEDQEQGVFGGYLVVNSAGRPLEFHCTAPLKPNRAQEILFGPTLRPYLYGEQIGQTLLGQPEVQPLFVCTDVPQALVVREFVEMPVALVLGPQPAGDGVPRGDEGSQPLSDAIFLERGCRLAVHAAYPQDRPALLERLSTVHACVDLAEPFSRIREAIAEVQKSAR
jgi:hypothetical protein